MTKEKCQSANQLVLSTFKHLGECRDEIYDLIHIREHALSLA